MTPSSPVAESTFSLSYFHCQLLIGGVYPFPGYCFSSDPSLAFHALFSSSVLLCRAFTRHKSVKQPVVGYCHLLRLLLQSSSVMSDNLLFSTFNQPTVELIIDSLVQNLLHDYGGHLKDLLDILTV